MLQVYGVDVLSPDVSTRRVAVLLDRLPPYARRFGEQWSTEAELLASLIDQVAALTWITLKAHGAKNVPKPRPIRRPDLHTQPERAPAPVEAQEGSKKASSWMDAAKQLAAIPGVSVSDLGHLHLWCTHHPCVRRHSDHQG
jgi:hypothetical protein